MKRKIKKEFFKKKNKSTKITNLSLFIKLIIFSLFIFLLLFRNDTHSTLNQSYLKSSKKENENEKLKEYSNTNSACDNLDPINLFKKRIDNGPIELCEGKKSKHICYRAGNNYYHDLLVHKKGIICEMENIVLDPSKSKQSGLSYIDGPIDFEHHGIPLLTKGFINAECKPKSISLNNDQIYETYLNSWNYEYDSKKEEEELEELAPGKTVFLISRNQDSPNLFHGNSEIINAISMIYLFNLDPKEIQVIFLESIEIPVTLENQQKEPDKPEDPFYYIYKNVISQGGEPIYIRNLKKKYKISKAIHVPINWDSPLYINAQIPKCDKISKAYKLYNDLVDKYMDLKPFEDKFITDNETFYYPESVIKSHESGTKFEKIVTIQWRKVWPKRRKKQNRIFKNVQQLTYKLSTLLPKNILIRLINFAQFSMKDQISIMRSTDYLIGIHGAGLSLSIFLPHKSIFNEFDKENITSVLGLMSAVSGHVTYTDYIKSLKSKIDGIEYIEFDENEFIDRVITHMKEHNFI